MKYPEKKRWLHLGALYAGNNPSTVWRHPDSRSQMDFSSFEELTLTAERGKFDFLFLAERLGIREHKGKVLEYVSAGRPDTLTILPALAAATSRIGLLATINTTFNDPFQVARQFATLEAISGGRSAWNIVTTHDVGENFSAGNYLDHRDRYSRAEDVLRLSDLMWGSWQLRDDNTYQQNVVEYHSQFLDFHGKFSVKPSPQGRPVIVQAGVSDTGRDFAAQYAEVIFTNLPSKEFGRSFRSDILQRASAFGRGPDAIKVMPSADYVIADTAAAAQEKFQYLLDLQVSELMARHWLEEQWRRDFSDYDVNGKLPEIDPVWDIASVDNDRFSVTGRNDHREKIRRWRDLADANNYSVRDLVKHASRGNKLVGTSLQVAEQIEDWFVSGASDGFIISPAVIPGGLAEFVDSVVPILQEKDLFRSDYQGSTLRDHLFGS
jgi:FMN-dependent oxidoreductase (nitrilotriacetate monooxygenase family)